MVDAPIRVFDGADDDGNPAAPCRDYIARLRAAGADAVMTEIPGALHNFDDNSNPAYFADSSNQTLRNRFRREEDGVLVDAATGSPFTYCDACGEYGLSASTTTRQLRRHRPR